MTVFLAPFVLIALMVVVAAPIMLVQAIWRAIVRR